MAPDVWGAGVVRRNAFVVRLAVATAVVVASPLAREARWSPESFGYAVGLGWVPAAGLIEMLWRRRPGKAVGAAALLVDSSLSLGVLLAFPDAAALVLVGQLLVVAYYAYVCGWRCGLVAAGVSLGVMVAPGALGDPVEPPAFTLAVYPVVTAAVALLLAGARAERSRMTAVLGRAQEKAGAILTGVAEAVVVTSPRGRIREWNEAAARTFECPAGEAVARDCVSVLGLRREIGQLDCSEGCALLGARLDRFDDDDDLTVWRPNSGGERQPLLAHVSPVVDGGGRVVEVVHSFRDITKLVRADEAKTVFLATASHELKTPLTVIMGYSELMLRQRDLDSHTREQGLKAIHERARQLTGIVNRILMSSRIEAGAVEVERAAADVRPAVDESVSSLPSGRGRHARVQVPDDLPLALVDTDAVRTILDQLLDNAAKYSGRDAPISVGVGADDRWVILEVADSGIGMTPEEVEHCFDRFWQAEAGDVRRFGGTGIGLYIVKSLADAMRGEVDVSSAPGDGTVFTVRLPRADAAPADEPRPAGEPEPSIIREFMRQVGVAGPGGSR